MYLYSDRGIYTVTGETTGLTQPAEQMVIVKPTV